MSRDADFLVSEAVLRRSMPWRLQNQHRLHFTQTHLSIDGIPGAGLALIENDNGSSSGKIGGLCGCSMSYMP